MANTIFTPQRSWTRLGTIDNVAAQADAVLTVAERDFITNRGLANVVYAVLPPTPALRGINALEARFLMTTDGANEIIDVWAARLDAPDDLSVTVDLMRVCSLDVECGSQDVVGTALHYADEIIITNNDWLKTVYTIQSGNDTEFMARLILDLCGYDLILFHGVTPATENCIVEISGF